MTRLLLSHWSLDPFLLVALAVGALHESGLRRLARRSRPQRSSQRRRRSWFFYGGLAVLVLTVESPIDYWSGSYFWVHMIEHLLLMFAAPTLVVAGAPWLPLAHGLPVGWRRRAGRALLVSGWSAPVRATCRTLLRPWVAVVAFNAVMVGWHMPALFDYGQTHPAVHIWLEHGSFFVAGVFFWLQFMTSHPFTPRLPHSARMGALVGSNIVMWLLAMAMGLFASGPWYSVYLHVPGATLPPLADQQIGAAILWVCGDFWCLPALAGTIRHLMAHEGFDGLFDRMVSRSLARASGDVPPPSPAVAAQDPVQPSPAGPQGSATVPSRRAPS
ncbi:MAG: cytochrome c oxidase assembly protein [Acidimicrobiales bacterium]